MLTREDCLGIFLANYGWAAAERRVLAADASFRRYDRLFKKPGETALLMDAPPEKENLGDYARVSRLLNQFGLSAPKVYAADFAQGMALIEDFGDRTYTRALAEGMEQAALYRIAVDVLIALHSRMAAPQARESGLPPYDEDRLLNEALLLPDWYLPAVTGSPLSEALRESYVDAWRQVFPMLSSVPQTLVLRDYHVDNLMVLPGREGIQGCGILDFQDAVVGPITYDLVSLLEDARRDVPPRLVEEMQARYLAAFPELDRSAFRSTYSILGAQRNAKIIGIFTRLSRRDGKHRYLHHIPRVWRLLEGDLAHSALRPVRAWFEEVVPRDLRDTPAGESAA